MMSPTCTTNIASENPTASDLSDAIVVVAQANDPEDPLLVQQAQQRHQQQEQLQQELHPYQASELQPQTQTHILAPGPHDVLLGRGGGTNNYEGNVTFRKLVTRFKPKYLKCTKVEKPKVAREVVAIWRKLNPPGRFLAKLEDVDPTYKMAAVAVAAGKENATLHNHNNYPPQQATTTSTSSKRKAVQVDVYDTSSNGDPTTGMNGATFKAQPPNQPPPPPPPLVLPEPKSEVVQPIWVEVGDKKAREKASQCLRERTADIIPLIKKIRSGNPNRKGRYNDIDSDTESDDKLGDASDSSSDPATTTKPKKNTKQTKKKKAGCKKDPPSTILDDDAMVEQEQQQEEALHPAAAAAPPPPARTKAKLPKRMASQSKPRKRTKPQAMGRSPLSKKKCDKSILTGGGSHHNSDVLADHRVQEYGGGAAVVGPGGGGYGLDPLEDLEDAMGVPLPRRVESCSNSARSGSTRPYPHQPPLSRRNTMPERAPTSPSRMTMKQVLATQHRRESMPCSMPGSSAASGYNNDGSSMEAQQFQQQQSGWVTQLQQQQQLLQHPQSGMMAAAGGMNGAACGMPNAMAAGMMPYGPDQMMQMQTNGMGPGAMNNMCGGGGGGGFAAADQAMSMNGMNMKSMNMGMDMNMGMNMNMNMGMNNNMNMGMGMPMNMHMNPSIQQQQFELQQLQMEHHQLQMQMQQSPWQMQQQMQMGGMMGGPMGFGGFHGANGNCLQPSPLEMELQRRHNLRRQRFLQQQQQQQLEEPKPMEATDTVTSHEPAQPHPTTTRGAEAPGSDPPSRADLEPLLLETPERKSGGKRRPRGKSDPPPDAFATPPPPEVVVARVSDDGSTGAEVPPAPQKDRPAPWGQQPDKKSQQLSLSSPCRKVSEEDPVEMSLAEYRRTMDAYDAEPPARQEDTDARQDQQGHQDKKTQQSIPRSPGRDGSPEDPHGEMTLAQYRKTLDAYVATNKIHMADHLFSDQEHDVKSVDLSSERSFDFGSNPGSVSGFPGSPPGKGEESRNEYPLRVDPPAQVQPSSGRGPAHIPRVKRNHSNQSIGRSDFHSVSGMSLLSTGGGPVASQFDVDENSMDEEIAIGDSKINAPGKSFSSGESVVSEITVLSHTMDGMDLDDE